MSMPLDSVFQFAANYLLSSMKKAWLYGTNEATLHLIRHPRRPQ